MTIHLQPNQTLVDGLVLQRCHSGCSHYVTTREPLNETYICNERFHQPEYIGWRMDTVTQNEMILFLRHQPYCADCIQDNNSYGFQAYNDLSRTNVDKVIEKYIENYPKEIKQPFMYSFSDKSLGFRIKTNSVVYKNQTDGFLNIETMIIEFTVCVQKGEPDDNNNKVKEWIYEEHIFDLSQSEEWKRMLEVFPQPLLESQ